MTLARDSMLHGFWLNIADGGAGSRVFRSRQSRPGDLDPAKGLLVAVPLGLMFWGLFGWLLWHLL